MTERSGEPGCGPTVADEESAGARDPLAAAEEINGILKLREAGYWITGARFVGRGAAASCDLFLNDGTTITFERVSDMAAPMKVRTALAATLGLPRKVDGNQTIRLIASAHRLAEHQASYDADEVAREWGSSFLQAAPVIDVDMADQRERWGAFDSLSGIDPTALRASGEVGSIAAGSPVLRDVHGIRYVRTGWFRAHVRAEESISSVELANRMQRVGWTRHGESGRIKATRPNFPDQWIWTFYAVPATWETADLDEGQVNG